MAEALAVFERLFDGIRLIAVGDDDLVPHPLHGGVDDEGRIFHLALVIGIDGDFFALFDEHAVAAVLAPAHDEIGKDRLFAVLGLADDDATPHIGVAGKRFFHGFDFVTHISPPNVIFK